MLCVVGICHRTTNLREVRQSRGLFANTRLAATLPIGAEHDAGAARRVLSGRGLLRRGSQGSFFAASDRSGPFAIPKRCAPPTQMGGPSNAPASPPGSRVAAVLVYARISAAIATRRYWPRATAEWRAHAPMQRFGGPGHSLSGGARFASLKGFLNQCRRRNGWSPFELMDELWNARRNREESLPATCLFSLLLCAAFTSKLMPNAREAKAGGPFRLSLRHTADRLAAIGRMPLVEGIRYILEAMILSQHFATAVGRFDGAAQRLRLTLEEDGLEPPSPARWIRSVQDGPRRYSPLRRRRTARAWEEGYRDRIDSCK